MTPKLITIPTSHYCEKVRWALDRAKIDYVEEAHAPLFARVKAGGTVPVLITDEGKIKDSTPILQWIDSRYPLYRDDAPALEDRFDEGLGVAARVVAFQYIAAERPLALRISTNGVPRWEAALARAFFGMASGILRRRYHVSNAMVEKSLTELHRDFEEVSARLKDGRRYLCGDTFTAADITFASLSGPVLLPEAPGARLPTVEEAPPQLATLARELRATPAGAFALRLYAEERGA